MEEALKHILAELQNVNHRLDRFEKGQQELKTNVTDLKVGQQELKTDVIDLKVGQQELKTDVIDLKVGQQELKIDVTDLKVGQQELKIDVTDLKVGQQELKTDVTDLKVGQAQLKENLINALGPYFEQIEKHIDVKIGELKDTLEDQQMVIDTLAARSVKHESEIKDFKRILKNQ